MGHRYHGWFSWKVVFGPSQVELGDKRDREAVAGWVVQSVETPSHNP